MVALRQPTKRLGELLLARGAITPAQLDHALQSQRSSGELLGADVDSVTVAVANPLDAWALSPFEQARRFRIVKPVLVLEEKLRAVHQAYRERTVRRIATQLNDHGTHEAH